MEVCDIVFARNPVASREPLEREGVADLLRLAIIAELDAISFYMQAARLVDDEDVRRVFLDVAEEEKEHVGEFLELLYRYDSGLAERLLEGAREVEELTGKPSLFVGGKEDSKK